MFEGYLCKRIKKKEITVSDILEYYIVGITCAILVICIIFLITYNYAIEYNLSLYNALITIIPKFVGIFASMIPWLVGGYIVVHVIGAILDYKVAACPNFKPEEDEDEDENE